MSKIVLLSNVPLGSTFRLGSHHLARELARSGHVVVHVSTPISRLERLIGREVKGRRGLRGSIPLTAAHDRVAAHDYTDEDGVLHSTARPSLPIRWSRTPSAVKNLLVEGPAADADIVMIDQLFFSAALERYAGRVIYRSTDVQTSPLGIALETAAIERSDGIVWASSFSAGSVGGAHASKPQLVLENGVDDRFFRSTGISRKEAFVYVGAIDKRFDWDVVVALARRFPDVPFRIAGPVVAAPPPLPASVQLLGSVAYEDVPELLQSATIGLLPLNDDPMNAGRSPMKFFEYLAAGLKVLARSTPELAARGDVPHVQLYRTSEQAVTMAAELLGDPEPNTDGMDVARSYGWASQTRTLQAFFDSLGGDSLAR